MPVGERERECGVVWCSGSVYLFLFLFIYLFVLFMCVCACAGVCVHA